MIEIIKQPQDQTAIYNSTAYFTVEATGVTSYKWYYRRSATASGWSATTMTGYNTATLAVAVTAVRNGYQYRCLLKDDAGNEIYTEPATLNSVAETFEILAHPEDQTVLWDEYATFSVEVSKPDKVTYQWQYLAPDSETWHDTNFEGYNTSTLRVLSAAARHKYQYRCKINLAGAILYSNAATLITVDNRIPVITKQPENATAAYGETVQFTVESTYVKYYTWEYRDINITSQWFESRAEGYDTATLTILVSADLNQRQYRCRIYGQNNETIYSEPATLTAIASNNIQIITQPEDKIAVYGDTVIFSVEAVGATTYQWYYQRTDITTKWFTTQMPGYNTPNLQVSATADNNGYKYKCLLTNDVGEEVYTDIVTLFTVAPDADFTILEQPKTFYGLVNWTAPFDINIYVNSNVNITYQWQYRRGDTYSWSNTALEGYSTPHLRVPILASRNNYQYRCTITSDNGATLTTETAYLYVIEPTGYYKTDDNSWKKGILYIKVDNSWKRAVQNYVIKE